MQEIKISISTYRKISKTFSAQAKTERREEGKRGVVQQQGVVDRGGGLCHGGEERRRIGKGKKERGRVRLFTFIYYFLEKKNCKGRSNSDQSVTMFLKNLQLTRSVGIASQIFLILQPKFHSVASLATII